MQATSCTDITNKGKRLMFWELNPNIKKNINLPNNSPLKETKVKEQKNEWSKRCTEMCMLVIKRTYSPNNIHQLIETNGRGWASAVKESMERNTLESSYFSITVKIFCFIVTFSVKAQKCHKSILRNKCSQRHHSLIKL